MKKTRVELGLILVLALISLVHASGLKVQPGGLLIQNVPPGVEFDVSKSAGIMLEIFNNNDGEHVYTITSKTPSQAGFSVTVGYLDIPDPSWFHYSKNEVRIPANGSASVRMLISIPNDERYIGKKWEVIIAVEGKSTGGETFALAAFPRIQIETQKLNNSVKFGILDSKLNPVQGAEIQLGTAYTTAIYMTDGNGALEIKNIDIGNYTVLIKKDGYSTVIKEITLKNTENIFDITIDKKPVGTSTLWVYLVILAVIAVGLAICLSKRKGGYDKKHL